MKRYSKKRAVVKLCTGMLTAWFMYKRSVWRQEAKEAAVLALWDTADADDATAAGDAAESGAVVLVAVEKRQTYSLSEFADAADEPADEPTAALDAGGDECAAGECGASAPTSPPTSPAWEHAKMLLVRAACAALAMAGLFVAMERRLAARESTKKLGAPKATLRRFDAQPGRPTARTKPAARDSDALTLGGVDGSTIVDGPRTLDGSTILDEGLGRLHLPDEATLAAHLNQYNINLARAIQLKREHGDLAPEQERTIEAKFDEMRETIRMTEELLRAVRRAPAVADADAPWDAKPDATMFKFVPRPR